MKLHAPFVGLRHPVFQRVKAVRRGNALGAGQMLAPGENLGGVKGVAGGAHLEDNCVHPHFFAVIEDFIRLAFQLGRVPSSEEVANYMGLSREQYDALLSETAVSSLVSFEAVLDSCGNAMEKYLCQGQQANPTEEKFQDRELHQVLEEGIASLRENGLSDAAFERAKRSVYGRNVAALNSAGNIANAMASSAFSGRELFRYIDCVAEADKESVLKRLEVQLRPEYSALSVVLPSAK